jgi:hypothetical protein
MSKTLQLFTDLNTLNTNMFTGIKVIKNIFTRIYTDTKVIKMGLIKTVHSFGSNEIM